MKRKLFLLMVLLLFSMLLSAVFSPCAVANDENGTRDLSKHLTIHYDFRGSTPEEQLKDKATAGSSNDDLTIPDGKSDIFTLTDGSIEQNASMVNGTGVSVYANSSSDIKEAGSGEGTWFVRFRATTQSAYTLIDLRKMGEGRPLFIQLLADGTIELLQSDVKTPNTYQRLGVMNIKYNFNKGEWCNLYIQRYLYLEEYYYKVYVSYADGTTLTASSNDAQGWKVGNVTDGLTPTDFPLGLFTQFGQTWPTFKSLSYDDLRYYNVALTEEEMQSIISESVFCENIGGVEDDPNTTETVEQISYDRNDLNSCMILHYDFKGTSNAMRLADKSTAGTVKDDLQFKEGTNAAYTFSDGTVKLNTKTNTYLYAPASDDLIRANMGEGSWFVRFSATEAPVINDSRVIIDFRQNSISRGLYLALRPDGKLFLAASSGTAPNTARQLNPVEGFEYSYDGSMINLFAVRTLADGKYYYTLYYSVGDSSSLEMIAKWDICDEESGLASTEGIPLGIYNQANVTWQTTPGLTIDDIRYYVVPLTTSEMATVVSKLDVDTPEQGNIGDNSGEEDTNEFEHHYREPETSRSAEFSTAEPGFVAGTPKTPQKAVEDVTESERTYETTAPNIADESTENGDKGALEKGCGSGLASPLPVLLIVGIFTGVQIKKTQIGRKEK